MFIEMMGDKQHSTPAGSNTTGNDNYSITMRPFGAGNRQTPKNDKQKKH
ncbi:MAG: hypothetical protein LBN74_01630 [Prevotella sp.]|nr:hypothetical protein [Prevotella sp.]